MNKIIKSILIGLAFLPSLTFAVTAVGWNTPTPTTGWVLPNAVNGTNQAIRALGGLFTSASSTFSGNFFLPALSQGFLYTGSNGLVQPIASSSVRLSWFNNDAGFSAFPFTVNTGYNSTSTVVGFTGGLFSLSSTTLNGTKLTDLSQGIAYIGSNGLVRTTATSTFSLSQFTNDLASLTATDGSLTFSGSYNGSVARTVGLNLGNANTWTALQTFTNSSTTLGSFSYSSSTDLRAGTATIGTLSGVLKASTGLISTASNGTDYTLISATTCSGSDKVSAISASGSVTCSADQTGGGGSGSGTVSTSTPLVSGQVAFSTGVSTIGNDSNFTFDSATDKLTVSLASTTGFSTSYASSTLGYIGSLFLPSVSQGYSYIGSNGLLNTISTSTLFSQMNLFDLDTNTPFGTPLNSVYRIRSSFNNFLSNSSFESWLSGTSVAPSGWTLAGDATVSRSSTATINSYSAQVVFGTANTGELYQVINTSTLVDYTFSAYVQRTSGTGNARLVAQRADAPYTEFVSVPLSTGGGWQLITLTVKPSAGTQTRFAIKSSDAVASTWLIDEAMFQEGKNLASTWLPAYIDDTNNQQVYGSKTFNALQTFNYSSSTYSSFLTSSTTNAYFGYAYIPSLGIPAGSFIAVDSTGRLIATTTPAGGGGGVTSVTGTYPIISSGGTTPAISIAFSTTTTNIWSALNTFNGGLTIGTTTAGILRTNASGVVYASSATSTPISLLNSTLNPDSTCTSTACASIQPASINAPASYFNSMVAIASSSTAKVGFNGVIDIPTNFASSTALVSLTWSATTTGSGNVVFDFDWRCVGGDNTTSLYGTTFQESTTTTVANPTGGLRKMTTLNANVGYYCSGGDTMQYYIARDGADGADTGTADTEIYNATIRFLTQ